MTRSTDRRCLRIDLQTHTNRSPSCGWMSPETLVRQAERVGLDGVAVTDHNTMAAVDAAQDAASDDFLVIPAEEVDTPDGQLIGLLLDERIEPWQSPSAVVDEIHAQDGLVLAPHPFDAMREGLDTIADHVADLDAVEVRNSRCVRTAYNRRAAAFAAEHGVPATGGSDAHFARELGAAWTRVIVDDQPNDGKSVTLNALSDAVRAGRVSPAGSTSSVLVHAGTKAVKLYSRVTNG